MQRPVMNPTFMEEPASSHPKRRVGWVWQPLKLLVKFLLHRPLARRRSRRWRDEEFTPLQRFIRGLAYRMAFIPVVMAVVAVALVVAGTHPPRVNVTINPTAQGIYYDTVSFNSEDGTPLEAWLIPAVDARRVLQERDELLSRKYPAAVLVHDFGASREQMLPLVAPLHAAGIDVLAVALRGAGTDSLAGHTFGINEASDVCGAIQFLRRRPTVDARRIAVVGVGTGATAAVLAAERDPSVAALVLENPARGCDEIIARHIAPQHPVLNWIRPLCKWTFEIAYRVDADELDLRSFSQTAAAKPVLMVDHPSPGAGYLQPRTVEQVATFLQHHLTPAPAPSAATASTPRASVD